LFRLVMIHHPPLPGQTSWARALSDAAQMEAMLRSHGAELVIHGHNHRATLCWVDRVPVVGGASVSLWRRQMAQQLARHSLAAFSGAPWRIELTGRALADPDGPIVRVKHSALQPSHAPKSLVP